ncbi:MAG: protein-glutamate O-methyltransferase CheR [Planctomycetota bacterium]|nr:MAG: protein-glutamate O-methyltransferase CheR [Planctomycetota bacterium]
MSTATISMTDGQFTRLRDIIYERSGIDFQPAKKYLLESRLGRRLQELEMEDYDQYIMFITIGPYRDDEFQEMFNRITINETSFFRNEPQLSVFENHALPAVLDARADAKRIRIWSAACSSGEEPFTLAMILHRTLGVRLMDWRIEILGTDISGKALEIANSGVYSSYAVRSTPKLMLDRYFTEKNGHYELDPEIRSMVSFETMNLKDRMAARRHGQWDVIFCRNVLIYFDEKMKKQVVQTFHDQLADDGWLFIGHSESIRDLDVAFEPVDIPEGFCHRKVGCNPAGAGLKLSA